MHYLILTFMAATLALSGCAGGPYGAAGTMGGQATAMGTQQAQSTAASALGGAVAGSPAATGYGQAAGMLGQVAASPTGSQASGLIDLLTSRLGITSQQATGASGAIFGLAKQQMNPGDFGQVSNAVPGMDQLLSSAPTGNSSSSSLLGAAGSMMGGQNSTLGSLGALAGSFQSLGLSPNMIGQVVPLLLQYVQGQGGTATMGLLKGALY